MPLKFKMRLSVICVTLVGSVMWQANGIDAYVEGLGLNLSNGTDPNCNKGYCFGGAKCDNTKFDCLFNCYKVTGTIQKQCVERQFRAHMTMTLNAAKQVNNDQIQQIADLQTELKNRLEQMLKMTISNNIKQQEINKLKEDLKRVNDELTILKTESQKLVNDLLNTQENDAEAIRAAKQKIARKKAKIADLKAEIEDMDAALNDIVNLFSGRVKDFMSHFDVDKNNFKMEVDNMVHTYNTINNTMAQFELDLENAKKAGDQQFLAVKKQLQEILDNNNKILEESQRAYMESVNKVLEKMGVEKK